MFKEFMICLIVIVGLVCTNGCVDSAETRSKREKRLETSITICTPHGGILDIESLGYKGYYVTCKNGLGKSIP